MSERRSKQVDVTKFSMLDTESWRREDVEESMRHILDNLAQNSGSISGWSSFLDDEVGDDDEGDEGDDVSGNDG